MSKYYHTKYHRRRKYHNSGIKSVRDLLSLIVQIILGGILIVILPYALKLYLLILENPIYIIPVCIISWIIGIFVYLFIEKRKQARFMALGKFQDIMKLDWREFEEFVAEMLKQKWFHTILWVWIKDGGVDVTATLENQKFFVQCKHYHDELIGVEKIRELHGVMTGEAIPAGWIFVTTTGFTADAISEAHRYGIELWDKNYLIEYLKENLK